MQVYKDELYHYGILGMKWGHHKAKVSTAKAKVQNKKETSSKRKKVKKSSFKSDAMSAYKEERKRQKQFLATQRAIKAGEYFANQYLANTNTTLNGKPLQVNHTAVVLVQHILNKKYVADSFR